MKHIITATVENQPGVLARIVGLISGRGYNIETLNVGPTLDPCVSQMTMSVPGDNHVLSQVTKQLEKLVDVIEVHDITGRKHTARELLLAEIDLSVIRREKINELISAYKALIITESERSVALQLVGDNKTANAFINAIPPEAIRTISRSGLMAISHN